MDYKVYDNESYKVHIIKTDKFKNIIMDIKFTNNIKEQIEARTLMFDMLTNTSNEYHTVRDLILKKEELYNAFCYSYSSKIGSSILSGIRIDFLNPSLTNEDYLEEALKLPFDLLFNPHKNNKEFNKEAILYAKNYILADIKTLKENPAKLAISNAIDVMDKKSLTALDIKGNEESVNNISGVDLVKAYNDALKHDYVDIFVIGDIDENRVLDIIFKYAKFNTIKNHELNYYVNNKPRKKVKIKQETDKYNQSRIVYILNVDGLSETQKKYAAHIYNMILGGGSLETKLSRNLRGDNSLCYNVNSMYLKYDNVIIISTGVDAKNIDAACSLIEKSIKDMKNISEDELKNAIKSMISSLNTIEDYPGRIINNYFYKYLGLLDDVDTRLKEFKNINIKDVLEINKHVSINTKYILKGDPNVKED